MDPVTLSLLMSAGVGAIKSGFGAWQFGKGKRLEEENVRPEYQIPDEVFEALRSVQAQMQQFELPGQDLIEQNLSESTAGAIRSAREFSASPAAASQAAIQAYASEMRAKRDIGIEAADRQDRLKDTYREALAVLSGYRDKAFQINEMDPYQEAMAASSAMKGAGIQNIFSGLSDIAGVGVNALSSGEGDPNLLNIIKTALGEKMREKEEYAAPTSLGMIESSAVENTYFPGSEEAALGTSGFNYLMEVFKNNPSLFTQIGG